MQCWFCGSVHSLLAKLWRMTQPTFLSPQRDTADIQSHTACCYRVWQQRHSEKIPDSNIHGANMGPIWGRQDSGWPHAGPTNFAIWDIVMCQIFIFHKYTKALNFIIFFKCQKTFIPSTPILALRLAAWFGCQLDEPYGSPGDYHDKATVFQCTYWCVWIVSVPVSAIYCSYPRHRRRQIRKFD